MYGVSLNDATLASKCIPVTGSSESGHYRSVGHYLLGMPELEATLR